MERITRKIIRNRNGVDIVYPMSTWDIIFQENVGKPNFQKLCRHLRECFKNGMIEREKSASTAPALMLTAVRTDEDMLVCEHAKLADYVGKRNQQHNTVENYFMDWHPLCFGVEIPVWNDEMCTCIDIVFYIPESDSFFLWDFKPNAKKEKKASTQVYWTKQLLNACAEIPLENISVGYFDMDDAFILND